MYPFLNSQLLSKWESMAEKLKEKILNSNFTFQNETLKFDNLNEINSDAHKSLSSEQILKVLNEKKLIVHAMKNN